MLRCSNCGFEWKSRVEKPRACPKCKSYYYNREEKEQPKQEDYINRKRVVLE